jgi:hypothetical protein
MSSFTKALLSKHAVVTKSPVLDHAVSDRSRSDSATPSVGDRSLRDLCPDQGSLALQAIEQSLGVHRHEPSDRYATVGHDNSFTIASALDPRLEVGSQLTHRDIHATSVPMLFFDLYR